MTYSFRPLTRDRMPLLLGVAGGTGSGKTMSALRLARGLADGKPFAGIDTENGRMSHYAELFPECHATQITAPFRPDKYADAIEAADSEGYPVVVVDSASHEWQGDGGCLDWHDELMGGNQAKNLSSWIAPKRAHKRMVTRLLQLNAHVILCFRAEPKVESITVDGKTKIVPKASLTGLDGWIPITEKNLPYELTASFLLMADNPGVPKPIKLEEQHRPFVDLKVPLDEETGRLLGAWAAGGTKIADSAQRQEIVAAAKAAGLTDEDAKAILREVTGHETTTRVPADKVADVIAAIGRSLSEPEPQPVGTGSDASPSGSESEQTELAIPASVRAGMERD